MKYICIAGTNFSFSERATSLPHLVAIEKEIKQDAKELENCQVQTTLTNFCIVTVLQSCMTFYNLKIVRIRNHAMVYNLF